MKGGFKKNLSFDPLTGRPVLEFISLKYWVGNDDEWFRHPEHCYKLTVLIAGRKHTCKTSITEMVMGDEDLDSMLRASFGSEMTIANIYSRYKVIVHPGFTSILRSRTRVSTLTPN